MVSECKFDYSTTINATSKNKCEANMNTFSSKIKIFSGNKQIHDDYNNWHVTRCNTGTVKCMHSNQNVSTRVAKEKMRVSKIN